MKRLIQKIVAAVMAMVMLFGMGGAELSPFDIIAYAEKNEKLSAPSNLTFLTGSDSVTINWNKVSGADGYKVGRYDSSKKAFIYSKLTTKTSLRITNLAQSSSYKFVVVSYDKINGQYVKQSTSQTFICKTTAAPTSLTLSASSKNVAEGEAVSVKATVTPNTFKDVVWKISDSSVAKITGNGTTCKILGIKAGTATITATAGKKKVSCKITVSTSNVVNPTERAKELLPDSKFYYLDDAKHVQPYLESAEKHKQEILNSKTEIVKSDKFIRGETYTGTAYYVSNSGNDNNNGLSPETAWKTLYPVNMAYWDGTLKEGDAVFLERGGVYRLDKGIGLLWLKSNVTYSAYGEGEKPVITLAAENSAREECWKLYYDNNGKKIWKYYKKLLQTGGIVFDDEIYAKRVYEWPTTKGWEATETVYCDPVSGDTGHFHPCGRTYIKGTGVYPKVEDNLKEDLTLICRTDISDITYPMDWSVDEKSWDNITPHKWTLYLRCDEGNPGTLYNDIEIVAPEIGGSYHMLFAGEDNGIVIDNISLKYFCTNAIQANYMTSKDIIIQNCTIEWGGNILFKTSTESVETAYSLIGDGIYGVANNAVIKNNYMRGCSNACTFESLLEYDFSGRNSSISKYPSIGSYTCTGNVVEYCGQGIRTFLVGREARFDKLTIADNYILHSGEYFNNACFETPCGIDLGGSYQFAKKFKISNNVVIGSTLSLIKLPDTSEAKVNLRDNVFIQERGNPVAVLLNWKKWRAEFIPFTK